MHRSIPAVSDAKTGKPIEADAKAEKLRRESAVMRYRRGGVTVKEVAEAFSISERTMYYWIAEFDAAN